MSTGNVILRAPDRLYHTKVRKEKYSMFSGVCVFVDHASGFMSIDNQVAINTT